MWKINSKIAANDLLYLMGLRIRLCMCFNSSFDLVLAVREQRRHYEYKIHTLAKKKLNLKKKERKWLVQASSQFKVIEVKNRLFLFFLFQNSAELTPAQSNA